MLDVERLIGMPQAVDQPDGALVVEDEIDAVGIIRAAVGSAGDVFFGIQLFDLRDRDVVVFEKRHPQ